MTKNDEILSKNIGIVSSSGDSPTIKITNDIFSKGTSGIWGDSDNEKQNYFIEVIPLDISAESKKFGVDSDGLMEVEKLKSPAVVKKIPKENNGKCTPCQIGLTVQDLDKFMSATPHGSILNTAPFNSRIPAYISYLNQYMTDFEINKNCYRRANFLGQVAKETKFWSYKEDFVYKVSVLKTKFSNFKTEQGIRYANAWGYNNPKSRS